MLKIDIMSCALKKGGLLHLPRKSSHEDRSLTLSQTSPCFYMTAVQVF